MMTEGAQVGCGTGFVFRRAGSRVLRISLICCSHDASPSVGLFSWRGIAFADETLLILRTLEVEILPFDQNQAAAARTAWQQFGKGRHPAALNFADCCAYAAAIATNQPLLFKGNDFGKTDVQCAEW